MYSQKHKDTIDYRTGFLKTGDNIGSSKWLLSMMQLFFCLLFYNGRKGEKRVLQTPQLWTITEEGWCRYENRKGY